MENLNFISEFIPIDEIKIYPNPIKCTISFYIKLNQKSISIKLYNMEL